MNKVKSFLSSENVIVAWVHGAYICYENSTHNRNCRGHGIDMTMSHVSHYRAKIYEKESNETVLETAAWKFKDELIKAVAETLNATGFVP